MGERNYDFIIYGASGYTGYFCVKNLVKINTEKNKNYSFAVAGRSEQKLIQVLKDVGEDLKQDLSNVPVIVANAKNKDSLMNMTKQCKVIVTVVGPYYLYGRPLVEACLETSTHYVDISGEPQFTEAIQTEYFDKAKEKGLYIISSCGFDSVPADLGSLFIKDSDKDVEIKTVEGYINVKNPKGFSINTGTFFSLLESLKNYKELRGIRDQMFNKFYKKRVEIPKTKMKIVHTAPYARNGFYLPFWPIDQSVVKRTQLFFYNEDPEDKPLSLREYMHVPTVFHAFGLLFAILSIAFFNLCSFTRDLLKKYPKCFTLGVFSSNGPTKEQVESSSFEFYLVGKGVKKGDPSNNVTKTLYIKGRELAYDATALMLINSGIVVLEELADKNKGNSGVVTPGYAFRRTNYVDRIRELGMEWRLVENK